MSPFSPEAIAARNSRRVARRAADKAELVPIASVARARRPGPAPATGRTTEPTATRELLFKAGAEQFARFGLDGVGVDEIARAAGVNKAMLYYHFKNKLELYREIVRDMLRAVSAAVTAMRTVTMPPSAIDVMNGTFTKSSDANPAATAVLAWVREQLRVSQPA